MSDLTLEQIAAVLDNTTIRHGELRAACPAHGGEGPNLSLTYKDGKLLATCHSMHCPFEEIMAAIRERLGEEPAEHYPVTFGSHRARHNGSRETRRKAHSDKHQQTWELRDAAGELVARHVREDGPEGKHIRWRMPTGTWKLDRPVSQLPLYGVQEAARASAGTSIVVTEGEKAADALRAVCAVHRAPLAVVGTVTGAASTPGPEALEVLQGRTVILWPDNDKPGFEHMGRIAEALIDVASEVRWFEWPEAPEKGDAADHPGTQDPVAFLRGGLLHQLLTAERWSRPPAIEGAVDLGLAMAKGIDPPEELLEDILLAAKAHNIYAPGGVGKTWVLIWLAAQLIKQGKKVAIFDLENGVRTYAERFKAMGLSPEVVSRYLTYYPFPMLNREAYERMLEEDKPDIVMFDSWIGFLAADGRDENVSNDISAWADAYSKPALRRGVAVVVLDHVPHEHKRERGSTRKRDEMDVVWRLVGVEPFDRERKGSLSLSKKKDREGWLPSKLGFEIGLDSDTSRFVMFRNDAYAHEEIVLTLTTDEKKALRVLETFGDGGARTTEWARAALEQERISDRSFYRLRKSLEKKGQIEQREERHFVVTATTANLLPGSSGSKLRSLTATTAPPKGGVQQVGSGLAGSVPGGVVPSTASTASPKKGRSAGSGGDAKKPSRKEGESLKEYFARLGSWGEQYEQEDNE